MTCKKWFLGIKEALLEMNEKGKKITLFLRTQRIVQPMYYQLKMMFSSDLRISSTFLAIVCRENTAKMNSRSNPEHHTSGR